MSQYKTILSVAVILLLSVIVYRFTKADRQVKTQQISKANFFFECETENRQKSYKCYKEVALKSMQSGGDVAGLASQVFEPAAHLKEHAIGRAVLITSGYDLMLASTRCPFIYCYGFYHGIAEEWGRFAPSKLNEYLEFSKKFCPTGKGCFHQLGHFIKTSRKNFEESMNLCDEELQDNDSFYWCAAGVVHQQFIDSGPNRIFELCSKYQDRRRDACYLYGSALYPKWSGKVEAEDLISICGDLGKSVPTGLNRCWAWVVEYLNKNQKVNIKLCDKLSEEDKVLCVESFRNPKQPFQGLDCLNTKSLSCGVF